MVRSNVRNSMSRGSFDSMILIIGGKFSGRHSLVKESASFCDVSADDALEFLSETENTLKGEKIEVVACLSKVVERISSFDFAIATEIGCGIVPISAEERRLRKKSFFLRAESRRPFLIRAIR